MTQVETTAQIADATNWLSVRQRVRISSAPLPLDGEADRRVGRTGVVWRLCSPVFADHV